MHSIAHKKGENRWGGEGDGGLAQLRVGFVANYCFENHVQHILFNLCAEIPALGVRAQNSNPSFRAKFMW